MLFGVSGGGGVSDGWISPSSTKSAKSMGYYV